MIWQDILLMLGGFGFSIALFPTALKKVRMPVSTTLVTSGILTSYLVVYATLGLWLAFIAGAITTSIWWYLFSISIRRANVKRI